MPSIKAKRALLALLDSFVPIPGGTDAAVVVLSGTSGVEVGTEKAYEVCDQLHLPRILFVSAMDKEHADFERVFQDVKAHLTPKVVPVEIPIGDGHDFHGIINLFSGHCHLYKRGTKSGEYDIVPIPPEYQERFREYTEHLTETVAATDDTLIERYLGGEEIAREEVIGAMKRGMAEGAIVPLFCGSADLTYGVRALLKKMVELFPSPAEVPAPVDAPLVGRVFKTVSEPHVGDVSIFRIVSGAVKNGAEAFNPARSSLEKLNHLSVSLGKDKIEVDVLHADARVAGVQVEEVDHVDVLAAVVLLAAPELGAAPLRELGLEVVLLDADRDGRSGRGGDVLVVSSTTISAT